jgi:hypothetical protein
MNKSEFVITTKPPFAGRHGNFIGGQWVAPKSEKYFAGSHIMRNHDLASGGFLAVTAVGFVLLCSSLLAFAFS